MSRPPASTATRASDGAASHPVLTRYEPVIGLEVHCQLLTRTKLFCACSTAFGALPNHHVCPVCLGLPGVLPVLNRRAVDLAVRLALAVGGRVRDVSVFARKQYFYPDLPKGYQITQYDQPYCEGGGITLASGARVPLVRIHIEEDAGKNVHGDDASFVDCNRAGTPLVEVVTAPSLHSSGDAAEYLRRLRGLVRHLDVCDGNMEEGSLRCDANVSLRPRGATKLGTRCEIKNLNSFRNVERAIDYEILRQADLLDAGETVVQATLQFDAASGRTSVMRSKEESQDYRYVPDPDLRPLVLSPARIAAVRNAMPELPEAMAERYVKELGLTPYDAALLTGDRDLARYFEQAVAAVGAGVTPKIVANWVTGEVLNVAHEHSWNMAAAPVTPAALAELLGLIGDGTISGKIAKTVFEELAAAGGGSARAVVEARGLRQVRDESAVLSVVDAVLAANPAQVEQFRAGKDKVFAFLVGQVMRASQGKANPELVNELLRRRLNPPKS